MPDALQGEAKNVSVVAPVRAEKLRITLDIFHSSISRMYSRPVLLFTVIMNRLWSLARSCSLTGRMWRLILAGKVTTPCLHRGKEKSVQIPTNGTSHS